MKIWVDADGCPNAIKEILFRAANRTMITTTLVANQTLPKIPQSPVSSGRGCKEYRRSPALKFK